MARPQKTAPAESLPSVEVAPVSAVAQDTASPESLDERAAEALQQVRGDIGVIFRRARQLYAATRQFGDAWKILDPRCNADFLRARRAQTSLDMAKIYLEFEDFCLALQNNSAVISAAVHAQESAAADARYKANAMQIRNADSGNARKILAQIRSRGIAVSLDQRGNIVVNPASALNATAREHLRQYKLGIVNALNDTETF